MPSSLEVDLKDLDRFIEMLEAESRVAIAEQDFDKAAHLRDQSDKLKKKKEQFNSEDREHEEGAFTAAALPKTAGILRFWRLFS